ncbi:MAG TPA: hypothetical protein VG188_11035 [Solirubrobacteraceae bacterium]|nr:hypothetical protein [Solirubrobacteraceae bacterium]
MIDLDDRGGAALEQSVYCLLEGREVAVDDLEHPVDVDSEVLIGDQVAQPSNVDPRNLGRCFAGLRSQTLDGLTYHHKLKEQCIVQHSIVLLRRI